MSRETSSRCERTVVASALLRRRPLDTLTQSILKKALSRRTFLAGAGTVAAASVIAGCGDDAPASSTPTTSYTDADYLNFALNLEYLEAEFYLRAATGSGLTSADAGGAGTVTGGAVVAGTTLAQQQYINEIAQDELAHVQFLRKALGSAAVPRPNIDFTNAFSALAVAAGVVSAGTTFNPFSSFAFFLVGAFIFEDVGVTAYTGAAPLLTSAANLNAAAGIQAVEAYHAAEIRTLIASMASVSGADQTALTAANKVSTLRGTLGGGKETSLSAGVTAGVLTSATNGSTIVALNSSNGVAYARTPSEVLHIVYGTSTANASSGAFFPNGLNGTIKVAS